MKFNKFFLEEFVRLGIGTNSLSLTVTHFEHAQDELLIHTSPA